MKQDKGQPQRISPSLANHINSLEDGGQPLPKSVRDFFEPRFGVDFSSVRVHTNGRAAETAKDVNARAFTVGRDVAFGSGQYAPESSEGRKLLAHELTHVVQQSASEPAVQRVLDADAITNYADAVEAALNQRDPVGGTGDYPAAWDLLVPLAREDLLEVLNVLNDRAMLDLLRANMAVLPEQERGRMREALGAFGTEQQSSEQQESQLATSSGEVEDVHQLTRELVRDFIVGRSVRDFIVGGGQRDYNFGPSHPWTQRLQSHPHMQIVSMTLEQTLRDYCKIQAGLLPARDIALSGQNNFNLNTLSFLETASWFTRDIANWMSWGILGQEDAFLFGSFRLRWWMETPSCSNGIANARVAFWAQDLLHVGSGMRIPMTTERLLPIPDQPFGAGLPLNDIPINWWWMTGFIISYP